MTSSARSKQRALSKITKKFAGLPAGHPDKPKLAKSIVALRAELAAPCETGQAQGLSKEYRSLRALAIAGG